MALWLTPPLRLTPCEPLKLQLEPPPGRWGYGWLCEPRDAPLCTKVLRKAEEQGYLDNVLEVSSGNVAGAAVETLRGLKEEWHHITVEGYAFAINGVIYARATNYIYFNAVGQTLLPIPGPTEFSVLDEFVRVGAVMETCSGQILEMSWAWRPVGKQWITLPAAPRFPRLKLSTRTFPKPGSYEIRGSLRGIAGKVEIIFPINITGVPPPIVDVAVPRRASAACDVLVDASRSSDPGGADLTFAWSCLGVQRMGGMLLSVDVHGDVGALNASTPEGEAAVACTALAANSTSARLFVPAGRLPPGVAYRLELVVARTDANSSRAFVLELEEPTETGHEPPVVLMYQPSEQISPQRPASFSALVPSSGACAAPPWQAWWLLGPLEALRPAQLNATFPLPNATLLSEGEGHLANLFVSPPFPAAPGRYRLRMVLSAAPGAPWSGDGGLSAFAFDSGEFVVDSPPVDGQCVVYPRTGHATTTPFLLGSLDWVDDDLPLQHRFSWRKGALDMSAGDFNLSDSQDRVVHSWTQMSPWSQSPNFRNAIFGSAGDIVVRAEAMDTLGSVSSADSQALIRRNAVVPSDQDLTRMLELTAASGDPFVMLAASSAIAATIAESSAERQSNPELLRALLNVVQASGALFDTTPDAIDASTAVVLNVLSTGRGPTDLGTVEVAMSAVSLVGSIAVAARALPDGLSQETAADLMRGVASVLELVRQPPVAPNASESGVAVDSRMKVDAQLERMRYLAGMMHVVTGQVADALLRAKTLGETVEVSVPNGPQLRARVLGQITMDREGATVGNFDIPPVQLDQAFSATFGDGGRRRLSPCEEPVVLHEGTWPSNIFGYVGGRGSATNAPVPDLPPKTSVPRHGVVALRHVEEDCCDIQPAAAISIELRACGRPLQVPGLTQPVNFSFALDAREGLAANVYGTRLCQYFNHTSQAWTDEGCTATVISDSTVVCSCNRFGTFTSAYGTFTTSFTELVHCAAVEALSMQGFGRLQDMQWSSGSITLTILLVLGVLFSCWSAWKNFVWQREKGLRRSQFVELFAEDEPTDRKAQGSLKRMTSAAHKHDQRKPELLAKVVWYVQWKSFNILVSPIEDIWMRSIPSGLLISIVVQFARCAAVSDIGLLVRDMPRLVEARDLHKLLHKSRTRALPPDMACVDKLVEAYTEALADTRKDLLYVGEPGSLSFISFLKMSSPLVQLSKASLITRRIVQVVAVGSNVLGAWLVGAVCLLASESTFSLESADECVVTSMGELVARDFQFACVGVALSWMFPQALLLLHTRKRPYREDKEAHRQQREKRRTEDTVLVMLGFLYIAICLMVTMLILANFREPDAVHFVLTSLFCLLLMCLLVPAASAMMRLSLCKLVMRNPRLKSSLGEVLEALARREAFSKSQVYGYDDDGRPVLRPQWLKDKEAGHPPTKPNDVERWVQVTAEDPEALARSKKRTKKTLREEKKALRSRALALEGPPPPPMLTDGRRGSVRGLAAKIAGADQAAGKVKRQSVDVADLVAGAEDPGQSSVGAGSAVPIQPFGRFERWATEWVEMQQPPESPSDRARPEPTYGCSAVQLSPLQNKTYERRAQKRFGKEVSSATVKDGRAPAALFHRTACDPPQWVHEWPLPPDEKGKPTPPPPPLTAWMEVLEPAPAPTMPAKSPKVRLPMRLALDKSKSGHMALEG